MSFENELENLQKRVETIENKVVEIVANVNTRVVGIESFLQSKQNYEPPAYPKIESKEKCEEAGGTWDPETKTCKFPKKEPKKPKESVESFEESSTIAVLPTSKSEPNVEAQARELAKKIGRR